MRDQPIRTYPRPRQTPAAPDIHAWAGGGIVLLGERVDARWVLARGWRQGDRLTDVRRWSFADPRAFAGQVRRLVRDATGDTMVAAAAGADAARWVRSYPATNDRDPSLIAQSP